MKELTVIDVLRLDQVTQLIDVRERDELDAGMIVRAVSLPMSEIGFRLGELDLSRPIVAVCQSGRRSASVAITLTEAGFACATMAGGMIQWAAEGLPVVHRR
ncbi:MAG: rhodanese-like domain-containing protein [Actinomycetota bacterium]